MTVQKFNEKLELEELALQELDENTYEKEINAEVEAYREQVTAKYLAIKDTEKTKIEARIALLKELKTEEETDETDDFSLSEQAEEANLSPIQVTAEVKPGV